MPLWSSSKRYRKSRPASRVSTLFSSTTVVDVGDDHAFSPSSNGYGPQIMPDAGFRPNNLLTQQSEHEVEEGSSPNRPGSSADDSSFLDRRELEPWSASTVGRQSEIDTPSKQAANQRKFILEANRGGLWSWIPHVAQSADDNTVLYRVKDVFLFAEQFVMNFYIDRASIAGISQEALSKVNRSQLFSTDQVQMYLTQGTYSTTTIKHILISLMLNLISFDTLSSQGSLLPKEFQNYIALAKASTRSDADEILHVQPALSAYRVLSAYIYSNSESDQNYLEEKRRVSNEVAEDFRSVFEQWLETDKSQEDWESSFHLLVNKSASLGVFLFSQPTVFFFDWGMPPKDQPARFIPVSPRLLRIYDDEAQLKDISDHLLAIKCGLVFEYATPKVEGS